MDIEHCREFIVLAQRLNFTEAAAELNMTQPALSKHVLALEKEFGTDLLDRGRRGLQLTEAGRLFVESAAAFVDGYDRLRENIAQLKKMNPLRIDGHLDDVDTQSFLSMVTMIGREKGLFSAVFSTSVDRDTYLERIQNDEIDLFLGYLDPRDAEAAGLCCRVFSEHALTTIMDAQHPLAERESVTLADLANETLLRYGDDKTNPAWAQIERAFAAQGLTPRTRFVPCKNDIDYFTTPLRGSLLIWKQTYRQIGLLIETGHRMSVPIADDARLTTYAVCRPETEEQLDGFWQAVDDARQILDQRRSRREGDEL